MKRQAVESRLTKYGWHLKRHGANHDIWTNGECNEYIPRHREINERLARKILKEAEGNQIN